MNSSHYGRKTTSSPSSDTPVGQIAPEFDIDPHKKVIVEAVRDHTWIPKDKEIMDLTARKQPQ